MHLQQSSTTEYSHCCGPVREAVNGDRYGIEYRCKVDYHITPGRKETWSEWDGGTPAEPPTVDIIRVRLIDVVIYAPPSYQTGVLIDENDESWQSFRREAEGWLRKEIESDFEGWVLDTRPR